MTTTTTNERKPTRTAIHTTRFEFAHGRKPRGRGGWLFETRQGEVVLNANGTYTEARKVAAQSGHGELWVCS